MANGKMQVDATLVRELAELLKETDLSEIEVADGERRVRVARQLVVNAQVAPAQMASPAAGVAIPAAEPVPAPVVDIARHPGMVPSPMVGTVYISSEPGKPPFVSVGTQVKEGDTLLIVEAMKVMNPILAPRAGTVTRILVENAQPIEFGEPLMIID
jgi:acetyl-CoA carboxylase biotin carboxyl carrier protein